MKCGQVGDAAANENPDKSDATQNSRHFAKNSHVFAYLTQRLTPPSAHFIFHFIWEHSAQRWVFSTHGTREQQNDFSYSLSATTTMNEDDEKSRMISAWESICKVFAEWFQLWCFTLLTIFAGIAIYEQYYAEDHDERNNKHLTI